MQIKSTSGAGISGLGADLNTRLAEMSQKAHNKAASIKSEPETEAAAAETTTNAEAQDLDFSNAQERSAFLDSLQTKGDGTGEQSGEMLNQHALDPDRVAQLLGL